MGQGCISIVNSSYVATTTTLPSDASITTGRPYVPDVETTSSRPYVPVMSTTTGGPSVPDIETTSSRPSVPVVSTTTGRPSVPDVEKTTTITNAIVDAYMTTTKVERPYCPFQYFDLQYATNPCMISSCEIHIDGEVCRE